MGSGFGLWVAPDFEGKVPQNLIKEKCINQKVPQFFEFFQRYGLPKITFLGSSRIPTLIPKVSQNFIPQILVINRPMLETLNSVLEMFV